MALALQLDELVGRVDVVGGALGGRAAQGQVLAAPHVERGHVDRAELHLGRDGIGPVPVERRPERLTGLTAAARDYAGRLRGRGPLILISDLLDPGYLDALRDLAGTRCQLSVLHVLAPEELDPDVPPDARLVDNETGHGIEVTGDDDLVDRYRSRLGEWQEEIAAFCARRGGAYVSVASDVDLSDLLFDVLRRRRVIE